MPITLQSLSSGNQYTDNKELNNYFYYWYIFAYGNDKISVCRFKGSGENSAAIRCRDFLVMESRCRDFSVLESQ